MKREIKFRGIRRDNGEWIYGDLNHLVDGVYISNDYGNNMAQVVPDTVGMNTGLKDKNGKEIYEGDIMGVDSFSHVVVWSETFSAFRLRGCVAKSSFALPLGANLYVVKGNIHDNRKGG